MDNLDWYELPLDTRAHAGGEEGVNGAVYRGGEFMPFYVPRPVMPQVDACDIVELCSFVKERGCKVRYGTADPDELKFHQRVDRKLLKTMPDDVFAMRVLISQDMYVLDGNHRTMRHKQLGAPVNYIMLDRPFEEAVALLMAFPKTYEYATMDA